MPPSNVPDTLMVADTFTVLLAAGNVGMVIPPCVRSASSGSSPPQEAIARPNIVAADRDRERERERGRFVIWSPRARGKGGRELDRDTPSTTPIAKVVVVAPEAGSSRSSVFLDG